MSKEYFQDSCALLDSDVNNKALHELKKVDRGFNKVTRRVLRYDATKNEEIIKNKEINVFTSNGTGFKIRDAETGDYTPYLVGSKDEDLFFKVSLSTGELKSQNGSNTLFYESPIHYMNHLFCEVSSETITAWENKKNERMVAAKLEKKSDIRGVEVR